VFKAHIGPLHCKFWGQARNIAIIENISKNLYNFFLQLQIIFLHANPREMGQID